MGYKVGFRIQTGGNRNRWIDTMRYIFYEDKGNFNTFKTVQINNLWNCAKNCLLSAEPEETHLVIMQDDILFCKDFITTINHLITLLPDEIITLFSNNEHIDLALKKNIHWLKLKVWFMAQCYIIPVKVALEMTDWIENYVKDTVQLDDDRMATYCFYTGRHVYATAPSLVEHLGFAHTTLRSYTDDFKLKSLHRLARKFIGFETSGMSIDWRNTIQSALIISEGKESQFINNLKHKL